jgi:hypothetical protein
MKQELIALEGELVEAKGTPARIERMIDVALRVYREPKERAAMRSALGDAAAICDMVAADIENANRTRSGKVINAAQEMAHQVRFAGDRIWRMREQITLTCSLKGAGE